MPAVLVAGHGPFVWGPTVDAALDNAVALEAVAQMAAGTWTLAPALPPLEAHLQQVHYQRKHGPDAHYGQPPPRSG
jgi:L-ribulose-5-phosphate 4-epimerase